MSRGARRLAGWAMAAAIAGIAFPAPAAAQTVSKNLQRSFNGEPYQASYAFFTAGAGEAMLDFSRLTGTCTDVGNFCTDNSQCLSGACDPLPQMCLGQVYVSPRVGQVSVLTKAEFCRAAACANASTGYLPPECDPLLYPCTTPCPNPSDCTTCAQGHALCLCDDGFRCPSVDATYGPGGAIFDDTFQSAANPNQWTLSHASIPGAGTSALVLGENTFTNPAALNAVAFASARVPLVPGQEYVLFFKHTISPFEPGMACTPYGLLQVHLEGRPPVCDSDQDGSPVDQDCQDGNPSIRPGLPDAICNGIDENCSGVSDEQFVPEVDRWTLHSVVAQPMSRSGHTMLVTGSKVIVWGGNSSGTPLNTGAAYDPVAGTWQATPTNGPAARTGHAAVWTGSRIIVWGGTGFTGSLLNDGGLYDPVVNIWTGTTNLTGAPTARSGHAAVWTGSKMVIWGGLGAGGTYLATGALYDPASNTWTPMSGSPLTGRFGHRAVWNGTRVVIWGGQTAAGLSNSGAIYDPKTDSWIPTAGLDAPTARTEHAAVAAGGDVLIWGGRVASGRTHTGARLDPAANAWTPLTTVGAPAPRSQHGAVWTGGEMIVWGGNDVTSYSDGARYDPAAGRWTTLTTLDDPVARTLPGAVWIPSTGQMMIWGGMSGLFSLSDGALYNPGGTCGVGACTSSNLTACNAGIVSYACTPGAPVPETCNGVDDNCDGLTDNGVAPVSGSPLSLQVSGGIVATLDWFGVPGGQAGDVVYGYVSALRVNAGNYAISTIGCLANDDADRQVSDAVAPAPGDALWYLVREVNLCTGPGTYDEGLPSQVAPRDAGIAASGVACP